MNKFYRIFLLLIALIFLTTYNPIEFTNFKKEEKFFFKIKQIEIVNNKIIESRDIFKRLEHLITKNIFFIKKADINEPLKKIEFLDKIEVKKKYPNTIIIKIYETEPIAIVFKNNKKYLLDDSSNLISYKKISEDYYPTIFGEGAEYSFADFFSSLFFIIDSKRNISRFCEWLIERWIRFRIKDSRKLYQPDGLFIKFYYPGETERELQLEILGDDPFFRANIPVKHGWNTQFIHYSEIKSSFLGIGRIRVWPSDDQPMRLIFTWLDLVIFQKDRPAKKVKCVCWDLDNTLWDGVIGDDGESGVKPNPKILTLLPVFLLLYCRFVHLFIFDFIRQY